MVNSKRAYARWGLPRLQLPGAPSLSWPPADPHLHRLPTSLAGIGFSLLWSLLLFSGSWCVQYFVCALQDWSLWYPQSCGSPIIKSHWTSRSDSLGIPSSFDGFPVWEAWSGVQNLHNSGETSLVLLFSSLWVTHLVRMGFDFIMIALLLPSHCSFFFVFEHGVSFSGGFQHPPVDGHSTSICNFGALAGVELMSFYLAALNRKSVYIF